MKHSSEIRKNTGNGRVIYFYAAGRRGGVFIDERFKGRR